MVERSGDGRRPLRRARQLRVQPRARLAPRRFGEGLLGQSRHPGEPHHGRQQGQGTAGLPGTQRKLLAAEPAGTLRDHCQVRLEGREGQEGQEKALSASPAYRARPASARVSCSSLIRYFATFTPSISSTGISHPYFFSSSGSVSMLISVMASSKRSATLATTCFISSHR